MGGGDIGPIAILGDDLAVQPYGRFFFTGVQHRVLRQRKPSGFSHGRPTLVSAGSVAVSGAPVAAREIEITVKVSTHGQCSILCRFQRMGCLHPGPQVGGQGVILPLIADSIPGGGVRGKAGAGVRAQVGELCARGGHPGGNQQRRGQAQPQMAAVRLGG